MVPYWTVYTRGDPLKAIRAVIESIWKQVQLDHILAPLNGDPLQAPTPTLIDNPKCLEQVNPFKPVMTENAARLIPEILHNNPQAKIGALLRPCEMRALSEMVKHNSFTLDNILTICVDCLGTFPPDEYAWRAKRKESTHNLPKDTYTFAKQGSVLAYRYRSVCQICISPEAKEADANIHVFGLPLRKTILVESHLSGLSRRFQLDGIPYSVTSDRLIQQHERIIAKTINQHQCTKEELAQNLGELLPKNINEIIVQLEDCGSCQNCMDVCPICAVDFPRKDKSFRYHREDIMRWLISCAGCGICEQVCLKQLPLGIIFSHICEQLKLEYSSQTGSSTKDPLPTFL